MSDVSCAPDVSALEIPIDAWTQPFWDGTARGALLVPCCTACGHFRWPPGPFCPYCQSQETHWAPAGSARIYSFTIVPDREAKDQPRFHVPALIEFPAADGIRFPAAIVDTPLSKIRIGADVRIGWSQAANARLPVFRVP
jgi:uncharacterized OB-fold protein